MKKRKKPWWAILYSIVLTGFSSYVLLDTFAIPKEQQAVHDTSFSDSTSYQIESEEATDSSTSESDPSVQSETDAVGTDGIYTENSYSDENISISISTIREYDTGIYIADIQLRSAEYLKTALAQNTYGRNIKETTSSMAQSHNAIFAINGDYYGFRDDGFVIRNGTLYRDTASSDDALVVGNDGTLYAVNQQETNASTLITNHAYQAFSFGPVLLEDGSIAVDENTEVDQAMTSNPRTAIGMISPLHYIIIVSDGRTSESVGLSLYQLASVFEAQNCIFAYNLDGGGSSTMWFNGNVINNPTDGKSSNERKVSDIVYIGY